MHTFPHYRHPLPECYICYNRWTYIIFGVKFTWPTMAKEAWNNLIPNCFSNLYLFPLTLGLLDFRYTDLSIPRMAKLFSIVEQLCWHPEDLVFIHLGQARFRLTWAMMAHDLPGTQGFGACEELSWATSCMPPCLPEKTWDSCPCLQILTKYETFHFESL